MQREQLQRQRILYRWKEGGMTKFDVGVIADADEAFTRDFLMAAKFCKIPQFQVGPKQTCKEPKLVASTMVFESSPECITVGRSWYHPDMIIGDCIEHIGDPNIHPIADREWMPDSNLLSFNRGGKRLAGWGRNGPNDYEGYSGSMYPLWNAGDFRHTGGGNYASFKKDGGFDWDAAKSKTGQLTKYTAFHFHNFFVDMPTVRNKYLTFGHATPWALEHPLGTLNSDLNFTVNCVMDRPDDGSHYKRVDGGYDALVGPLPVAFEDVEYRNVQHKIVVDMVKSDEAIYGYCSTFPLAGRGGKCGANGTVVIGGQMTKNDIKIK
jgi:hypothetical protein